jgi:hypothetical protein
VSRWQPLLAAVLGVAGIASTAAWLSAAQARDEQISQTLAHRATCLTMAPTTGVVVLLVLGLACTLAAGAVGVLGFRTGSRGWPALVTVCSALLLVVTLLAFALAYSGDGSEVAGPGWPTYCSAG